MLQQVTEFLNKVPGRCDVRPTIRCSACIHGVKVRAFPEIVDCAQTNRMQNADLDRMCIFFVGDVK